MKKILQGIYEKMEKIQDLKQCAALLDWDQQTYMPGGSISNRASQLASLQKLIHDELVSTETEELLQQISKYENEFSTLEKDYFSELKQIFEKEKKLPSQFVEEFANSTSKSVASWQMAKYQNNFKLFLPHLEKVLDLSRQMAEYFGYDEHPYDALLDQYEPQTKSSHIAPVFEELSQKLPIMLKKYSTKTSNISQWSHIQYSPNMQLKIIKELIKQLGFDFNKGRLDESAHPFTTSFSCNDVRLTTHINKFDLRPALFGAIHECGHGIYEQNIPESLTRSPLGEAASLGFHESQSRFYENIVGRSLSFSNLIFPKIKNSFQLPQNLDAKSFYLFINQVQASPIRIEADEISYNLHIIIRFELEKKLIEGKIKPKDLPEAWNELYKKYLGITPNSDKEGVLQDIHWSAGLFGYFPTYTLGNLISAQLKEKMEKQIGHIEKIIEDNNFSLIKNWFIDNIYKYGKRNKPLLLLKKICNSELQVEPFYNYLEMKFENLHK